MGYRSTLAAVAAAVLVNMHATEAAKPAKAEASPTVVASAPAPAPKAVATAAKAPAAPEKKFLMGYYPNWSHYSGFTAEKIPYEYLTHILYAFYITDAGGNLVNSDPLDGDNFKKLIKLSHEKGVKVLLSIGGASQSEGFKGMARSDGARANFVKNCMKLAEEHQLDGIDLDWEFPVEGDGEFQLKLHKELRAVLDKQPRKVLLTAAVPASDWWAHHSPDSSFHLLDYLNVMTYDYMGTWEKYVLHNSGMDMSKATMEYYVTRGIPKEKLVIGAAFYGKSFDNSTGMGSTYEGIGSGNNGVWLWKDLISQFKAVPYKIMWDEKTESEFALGNEEIIVFNGLPSQRIRGEYVRKSDYAGVMLWDLLSDSEDKSKSLLVALYRGLRGTNKGPLALPPMGPKWEVPVVPPAP